MSRSSNPQHTSAFIAALAAFATWGLVPIYWKLLSNIPALEILAHRFVWTIIFLGVLLSWQRRWPEVIANLRTRRNALFCFGSGVMVSVNWLLFIWAVNIGRVLETSLGYFMTPLVNVLLGAVILRERLSVWQIASILIAAIGISVLALEFVFRLGRRLHFVFAPRTLPLMLRRLTFFRLWHDEILSISMRLAAVVNFCEKIRSKVDVADFRLNVLIPRKRGLL